MKILTFAHNIKIVPPTVAFFFALLSTTALPILMNPPAALAGSNNYPTSISGCKYVSGNPSGYYTCDLKDDAQDTWFDPWLEENRECTSYAAWMLSSVNGFTMPFNDDAVNWGTDASSRGYTVNMTPAVGSIYWSSSSDHVAYVESVSSNGSTVTTEDYNAGYPTNPGLWAEHTGVATSSASGYIHFKDTSAHWIPLAGDWTGKGYKSIGLYNPTTATFMLRNSNTPGNADITAVFGNANWVPLVGDWNNDGKDTIGVYDPSTARFYLSNSNTSPNSDISSVFGSGGNWVPLAGDWDNYLGSTIGVYDPSTARFYLSNYNTNPQTNYSAVFGSGGNWVPLAGNWDGYLSTTIGVYNPTLARFYLSNSNTSPQTDYTAVFGSGGTWEPVVGDWDGNGTTTIGIYDHAGSTFYLSNSNTSGIANITVPYGNPN